jgi:hypothetical protein
VSATSLTYHVSSVPPSVQFLIFSSYAVAILLFFPSLPLRFLLLFADAKMIPLSWCFRFLFVGTQEDEGFSEK